MVRALFYGLDSVMSIQMGQRSVFPACLQGCGTARMPEKDWGSPGTGVKGTCVVWVLETEPGSLEEQQVLLTIKQALQPHKWFLIM